MAMPFLLLLLQGCTIDIITPMFQASTCGRVLAPASLLALLRVHQSNGSRMFMLRIEALSEQDCH